MINSINKYKQNQKDMMVTKDREMYGYEKHFIVHSGKHFKKKPVKLDNLFSKLSQGRAMHAFCFSMRDPI